MLRFPYTRLIFGGEYALAVAGPDFYVIDIHTGEVIRTTTEVETDVRDKLRKSGPIRCVAVDSSFTYAITTGDEKKLRVWQVRDELKLLSERELPKKPTEIGFTHDGQTIVVSDKFGDIFSYSLHPKTTPLTPSGVAGASKRGSLNSHENPSDGTLILGHASMLTTYILTPDKQYIITADRDEHIRISWFPKGYVIERYCLGHEKFVSALHIPSFKTSVLVSGGGDSMLKIWDWMTGKLLAEQSISEAAEPYIKVRAPKWRHGWNDGDGEGEGGPAEGKPKGKGKGRRRGKGKKGSDTPVEDQVSRPGDVTDEQATEPPDTLASAGVASKLSDDVNDDTQLVFAVQRLQSVDRGQQGRFILFSVFGATAIFYAPFPADGEKVSASAVRTFDLDKPVVDFTVDGSGRVWASIDASWGIKDAASESVSSTRLLTWHGVELIEASMEDSPLLATLKAKCAVDATPVELKTLDLYSALSSLPKNVDPEHDPLIRDTLSEAAVAISADVEGKQLTQRELGRLKKKKALLAKIQAQEQQNQPSREGSTATDGEETGREVKRARSESTGEAPTVTVDDIADAAAPDVEMSES
ncbi:WD40-repeat-containing domain protein [Trametes maxima]|nr:WD40-repeat-containing domain protein [Trametes maxima]